MRKSLLFMLVGLFLIVSSAMAANYDNPIEGTLQGIYGDTITIEIPSKVSKSSVNNEEENGNLSFQFNSNTGYRNFHQLSELDKGGPVKIEYRSNESGKEQGLIAVMITKITRDNVVSSASSDVVIIPAAGTQTITTTTVTNTTVNELQP